MSKTPKLLPWESEGISIASTLLLRRNLARYNFPSTLKSPEDGQVKELLHKVLEQRCDLASPTYTEKGNLSAREEERLFEHFLFLRRYEQPPTAAAIILEESGSLLTTINTDNHLELHTLTSQGKTKEAWDRLSHIEAKIEGSHELTFSPKFGYLTSDPAQCGTGLTYSIHLHLPALISTGQLEGILKSCDEEEIHFMGITGNLQDLTGDTLIVQNQYTLGLSEEAILHSVQKTAEQLINAEKKVRAHLKEEKPTEIKDLVSKSFGLLVHSYQLETKEALDLLSVMKLGLAIGGVENVQDETLSQLFMTCRRGHLSELFPDIQDPKELAHKRAEHIHHNLMGISLNPDWQ